MARYHFTTVMAVTAPRERVWASLGDPVDHARFWRWLERVDVLTEGEADGVGARHRFTFRTALPYTISFESEIVRRDGPKLLQARADGDLRGTGRWTLREGTRVQGTQVQGTEVTYEWLVETTKPWMNVLAPVARPVFRWNHDVLMKDLAEGLATATDSELVHVSSTTTPPGAPGFYELASV